MASRPQVTAMVTVQTDESIRANLRALLAEVLKNPEAKRSFLVAMSENSDAMAALVVPNPQVMAALLKAMVKVGMAKGGKEIEALAKALDGSSSAP